MAGATRRILRHYGQCKLQYEIGQKTEIKIKIGIEIEIAIGGIEIEIEAQIEIETKIERNVK